jgi:hypothetical protein
MDHLDVAAPRRRAGDQVIRLAASTAFRAREWLAEFSILDMRRLAMGCEVAFKAK